MTQATLGVGVVLHEDDNLECPFCPGKETKHEWKTFKGDTNDSGVLRSNMNDPSRCSYAQQTGAKPKDGNYPNQNIDSARPSPNPIYTNEKYGDYSNQAHHCISGNEIMKGEALEKIIANETGDYKGQTGYTINNAANGVYLPSYPENYSGNAEQKYQIVKLAMIAGKGQIHIGGHTGHENAVGDDYPKIIKKELAALKKRILDKSEECPFCVENNGSPKKPFIPPYRVNQWLDKLSRDIDRDLTGPVKQWPYFVSKYAKRYFIESTAEVPDPLDDL